MGGMDNTKVLAAAVLVVGVCLLLWCMAGGISAENMHNGRGGQLSKKYRDTAEEAAQFDQVKRFIIQGYAPPKGPGPLLRSLGVPANYNNLPGRKQNVYWVAVWDKIFKSPSHYPRLFESITQYYRTHTSSGDRVIGGPWVRAWQYILLSMPIPERYAKLSPQFAEYNKMSQGQKQSFGKTLMEQIYNSWGNYGYNLLYWTSAQHPEGSALKAYLNSLTNPPMVYDSDITGPQF